MDAVTLRHVDKAYTSYSTEIVITGEQRQSRTRQVLKLSLIHISEPTRRS